MRLLHTSDWHLGQSFHQFDRRAEHQAFLDWLLGVLEAEAVDALLIAGDVFDTSNPSAQAQAQLYRFLAEARRRLPQLGIVMTAGNHDSPGRLEAPAPLLSALDAHVLGQVGRQGDVDAALGRLLVPLRDAAGREAAWCIAMPFLRPDDLPRVEGADDPYAAGVAALYRRAFALADARRQPGQAIVALGHLHLAGGEVSEDSERRIVRSTAPDTRRSGSAVVRGGTNAAAMVRAGLGPLDDHAVGVSCERTKVSDVGRQDDPVGLGRRDDERVDRRASARGEAQRSRPTREDLGDALLDVARPEQAVHVGVATGVAGQAFDEHWAWHERRPKLLATESRQQGARPL